MSRTPLVNRIVLAVGATAAGLTWAPAFESASRVTLVVAVVAVMVAAVLPSGWWALPVTLAVPIVVTAVNGAVGVSPSPGDLSPQATDLSSLDGWVRVAELVISGPSRALRLTLPLPEDLLVVPALLTGIAAAGGAVLARNRSGRLVILVPAAVSGAFGVLAAGLGAPQVIPAALGLAAAGILLVADHRQPTTTAVEGRRGVPSRSVPRRGVLSRGVPSRGAHPRVGPRRAAAAGVVLVAAVPLAWVPGAAPDRADPRDRFRTAARVGRGVDVLDQVGGWLAGRGGEVLFRADRPADPRWRLAVLDGYDGETWRSTDQPVPAGLGVPPHHGPVPAGAVTWTVDLAGLRGPYLPVVDRPIRISPPVDALGPVTGNLYTADGASRYRFTALTGPFAARAALAPAVTREVPDDLRAALAPFTGTTPEAVIRGLRQGRRNVIGAPVSSATTALKELLRPGGSGTTVQFAAAFALLMRMRGTPSRLVVGFAGKTEVHARDVQVWTELFTPRTGWSAYDPAPPPTPADVPHASPPPVVNLPDPPPPLPSPSPTVTVTPHPRPKDPTGQWLPVTLAVMLLGAALLLLLRWLIPIIRRSLRRHRPGPPGRSVTAAWRELLDACEPPPGVPRESVTPARLHELLADRLASAEPAARHLRDLADRALYSPDPGCTPADARQAWQASDEVRRALTTPRGTR